MRRSEKAGFVKNKAPCLSVGLLGDLRGYPQPAWIEKWRSIILKKMSLAYGKRYVQITTNW